MLITLAVERSSTEGQVSCRSLVSIDPDVQERHSLETGQLVRLATNAGKQAWARIGPPQERDRGSRAARLDRFQRQTLKARAGEEVELYREAERSIERLHLQPAVDLFTAKAHHIEEHLQEELIEAQAPVCQGQIMFVHFHHSVAGILYKALKVEPGPGVVGPRTEVVLEPAPEGFGDDLTLDTTFDDVGGLDSEIRLVRELVQVPLRFPGLYRQLGIRPLRGIIFYGPPGTGKTHLARAIANEFHAQFFYVNGPELIGSMYAETESNLRKLFSEATHHAPSIIFLDELDVMAPKRGQTGSHADTRMVAQLLSLMDGISRTEGVVVIGTTNRVEAVDRALRRPGRFDREVYLGPPTEAGRLQVLQIHAREMPLSDSAREYLPLLAKQSKGFVGADVMELCREAGLNTLRRAQAEASGQSLDLSSVQAEGLRVEPDDFIRARTHIRPSTTREAIVEFPEVGFDGVGGLISVKEELREHVVAPLQDAAARLGHDGVLLAGPPGTGKSLLARAAAKEAGVGLIVVNGPELFTKWLGESEEAVRHVFLVARQLAPCLIFFDQLDALAPTRSPDSGSRTTERVVSQLLAELDGIENTPGLFVLAATSRIDLIDASLLRPGRFGLHIRIALPDREERAEILALNLKALGIDNLVQADWREWLVAESEGQSGADLRRSCQHLLRRTKNGAHRLTEADLKRSLQRGP